MSFNEGEQKVRQAVEHLRQARNLLTEAGATKAVEKVRSALKSAEGAVRHAARGESARCASTLSGMQCELAAGHGPYHKHGTAGWEDPSKAADGPVLHFAALESAAEHAHNGPALCGAGFAQRTEREQYVTGIFDDVTCRNCLRKARAKLAREELARECYDELQKAMPPPTTKE